MPESDEALMIRVGAGDAAAFRDLVRRYEARARRYCFRIFRDSHLAEDLAQEVFLKLYRTAERYEPTGPFRTYFYRVLANHCFDRLRFLRRRAEVRGTTLDARTIDGLEHVDGNGRFAPPEAALLKSEEAGLVRRAVEELPENLRRAVVLREFEGLKYREIADVLGVSLNEVKVLIHRGRKQLAKRLRRVFSGEMRP